MSVINIATALYRGTRALTIPVMMKGGRPVSLSVGGRSAPGQYISEAHKKSLRASSANNCAKLSYAAIVLEYLLLSRMNALEGESAAIIYCEQESSGNMMRAYYDGSAVHWENEPANSGHICIPFVMFALRKESQMSETKALFSQCVSEFKASGYVSEENLFKFCDAFYYEWKEHYPQAINSDVYIQPEIIRQMIRVKQLRNMDLLEELDLDRPAIQIEPVPAAEPSASAAVTPDATKFSVCRKGHYILDYCWTPEQAPYIPDLEKLDGFVPSEAFYTLVDLMHMELNSVLGRMDEGEYGVKAIDENYINAILVGKPGTGKTTLANALGAAFGMPVRVVAPNKHTEEDLFTGMTKVAEGGFRFCETPFLDVYKNGGILLMEEFNLGDPAVLMGALGQAIEKPFILYEDGYKEVRRHPLCVIISTMNSGTQGSREPSEAFTSRSPDTFMLDDPEEGQFIEILKKKGYGVKDCRKVYNAYSKIVSYLSGSSVNAKDVALSVTLRHCIAALRQMKLGRSFKQAVRNTMIGTIAIKDLELANQTYDAVVEPLRD